MKCKWCERTPELDEAEECNSCWEVRVRTESNWRATRAILKSRMTEIGEPLTWEEN